MATDISRIEDADYQLFWREVIEAVKHVELNHGLSYTIERGTRSAEIKHVNFSPNPNDTKGTIFIIIDEIEPKQPALLVP